MATIELNVKQQCIELSRQGKTAREVFKEYYLPQFPGSNFDTFSRAMRKWKKKCLADEDTLHAGTYPDFKVNAATVQVDRNGVVTQAWIKQKAEDEKQVERLISAIREDKTPVIIERKSMRTEQRMLEIPLFDMHFPLGGADYYDPTLQRLYSITQSAWWEEINITIGQDLFHNDDFRGRTSKGTQIEKVDMAEAWETAKRFYMNLIIMALGYAATVNIIYTKGNHDESLAWAFVQLLKEKFPAINVDDSLKARKCISWRNCFIGIVHGCETKSKNNDLRGQFTIQFPAEFASATVREIHSGHLHHEKEGDIYGVMIRRLSSGLPTDEWSDDSGYVGAHKRFMVFGWEPGRLSSIHYV